jgi:RimJ/RimL family protein N-acetyltransferase
MSELSASIFLKGKKVLIRPLQREDVETRLKWQPYPDPLYFHYNLGDITDREKEAWFHKRKTDPFRLFLSIDDLAGRLVGFVSLHKMNALEKTAWFGIYLGYEFVDRGLGTDATLTLLRYYFEELKFERLFLDVAALNKRAIRCYEKCGFRFIRKKYNDHDPRMSIDIFGDDRFKNIRRYFVKNGDKVLVEFDEMEITREMYEARIKRRS